VKARLNLILSVATLLPLAVAAFGQSPPPGPQIVQVPALMLPPTPPVAGGMIVPQLRQAPKGMPGFYDPATGKFTPSGGLVPKRPGGGVVPNAPADADFTVHIEIHFNFDSDLKSYNTLNCTAQIEALFSSIFTYEVGEDDDASYQTAVGNPPEYADFGLPITGNLLSYTKGSMSCTATDDNGVLHQGSDAEALPVPESGSTGVDMRLDISM
jgi:hypothetical protein